MPFSLSTSAPIQISTANTARDGSGTLGTLVTAVSPRGTVVTKVSFMAAGTVTNGVVRLFVYDGSNTRLINETLVTATTPSTTQAVWSADVYFATPLYLAAGWILKASTHNAEAINVVAYAQDL